jgi:hypothetical protein
MYLLRSVRAWSRKGEQTAVVGIGVSLGVGVTVGLGCRVAVDEGLGITVFIGLGAVGVQATSKLAAKKANKSIFTRQF